MGSGITGNPWIDVPLFVGGALLSGGSDTPDVPWQTSATNTMNYANAKSMNPLQKSAYYRMLQLAGYSPEMLTQYAMDQPMSGTSMVLGFQPQDLYSKAMGMDYKAKEIPGGWYGGGTPTDGGTTGSAWWGKTPGQGAAGGESPKQQTYTVQDVMSEQDWGKPYSSTEEQAIINTGYTQAASTIDAAAQQRISQMVAQGMSPEQAADMTAKWAQEQKMRHHLTGEANLTQQSIGELQRRLAQLAGFDVGVSPQIMDTSGAELANRQYADQQQTAMWQSIENLIGAYGALKGTKSQTGEKVDNSTSSLASKLPTFRNQMGGLYG